MFLNDLRRNNMGSALDRTHGHFPLWKDKNTGEIKELTEWHRLVFRYRRPMSWPGFDEMDDDIRYDLGEQKMVDIPCNLSVENVRSWDEIRLFPHNILDIYTGVSVDNIQKTVADYYKIKVADMYSKKCPSAASTCWSLLSPAWLLAPCRLAPAAPP